MKSLFLIAFIAIQTLLLNAQNTNKNIDVLWSEEIKRPQGISLETQVFDESVYVHIWHDVDALNFVSTGSDNKVLNENRFVHEHKQEGKKSSFIDVFRFNEWLYVITSVQFEKSIIYYLQKVNPNTLIADQGRTKLGQKLIGERSRVDIELNVSNNYNSLFVSYTTTMIDIDMETGKMKIKRKLDYTIFDENFEVMASKEIEPDDFGEIPFLGNVVFGKNTCVVPYAFMEMEDDNPTEPNTVLCDVIRNSTISTYSYQVEAKYKSPHRITFGKNDEVVIAGYLIPKEAKGEVKLFFISENIADKKLNEMIINDLPEDIIKPKSVEMSKGLKKDLELKKGDTKMLDENNLTVRDIVVTENGFYLIGEVSWTPSYSVTNSQSGSLSYHNFYYNLDILVSRLDEGKLEWSNVIVKNNYRHNSYKPNRDIALNTFKFFQQNSDLYFAYNDHLNNHTNFDRNDVKKAPIDGEFAVVGLTSIDSDGELYKSLLFKKDELELRTFEGKYSPYREYPQFFIIAQSRKNFKIATIKITE